MISEVLYTAKAPAITISTSQSQGERAVTIRPPSRKPVGIKLNRFRKYPGYVSAEKNSLPVAKSTPFLPHELHPIPLLTAFPPEANS